MCASAEFFRRVAGARNFEAKHCDRDWHPTTTYNYRSHTLRNLRLASTRSVSCDTYVGLDASLQALHGGPPCSAAEWRSG